MYKFVMIIILFVAAVALFYLAKEKEHPNKDGSVLSMNKDEDSDASLFSYWKEFKANSGKFEVLLPATPQYAKDYVVIPKSDKKRRYEIYASEKLDGTVFMVTVITYPPEVDTTNTKEVLKDLVDELILGRADNQLIELKSQQFLGHLANSFDIENKQFRIQGTTFLDDKTLYVLSYIVRKEDYNAKEFNYFVDSFKLEGVQKL